MAAVPQAILLDFYGTVVEEDDALVDDICRQIAAASPLQVQPGEVASWWGRAFRRSCTESYGPAFRLQREIERLSLAQVLARFAAGLDADVLAGTLFAHWTRPALFAESREVLGRCVQPICLVSNIDDADLAQALRHTCLHFDHVVTSEGCRAYKPRREVFERALSLLGLPAERVLHVGDSLSSDVRGAQAAGIPVLWINRKQRPLPGGGPPPDHIAADLRGLLDLTL